jgi:Zn/Cd-binding protein ZinT
MGLKSHFLLMSSIALCLDSQSNKSANVQGRKLSDWEIRYKEGQKRFEASKKKRLTVEQQKKRNKSKRAKQARKLNRKNLVNQLKQNKINEQNTIHIFTTRSK